MQAVGEKAQEVREASGQGRSGKYLSFQLGSEEFAIRVTKVKEIMGVQEITAIPQMPQHVRGVINLRGKVIPAIDLRLKFGLEPIEYTQRTCIIVVQAASVRGSLAGAVVDGVSEVLNLAAGDIEDTRGLGEHIASPYLIGMAKVKGRVKILLDIECVLSMRDIRGLPDRIS